MTRQINKKLLIDVYYFGRHHGLPSFLADDFAQFCMVAFLSGRQTSFERLLVDFKRKEFGDSRRNVFKLKKQLTYSENDVNSIADLVTLNPAAVTIIREKIQDLSQRDHAIFWLHFGYGFTEKEIGEIFGISEARISQILSKIAG